MSKQNIAQFLRFAIWSAHDKKSGYEGMPISFEDMEIDHIIPERVLYNPREPDEFEKWKEKYNLDNDFDIHGIENLCPSTRAFNLKKSDNGLYDETDAFKKYIIKALIKSRQLKPKIEELSKRYKKEFDARKIKTRINDINTIKQIIKKSNVDIKTIIESLELPFDYNEIIDIEEKRKYDKINEKYRINGMVFFNYGEYLEIKDCIRYSYNNKLGEETFWISIIDDFIDKIDNDVLKKKLFYEKAFAMFKTEKEWTPIEVELLEYFKSIRNEGNMEVLEQSANLFNIFYGELQRNRVKSELSSVLEIRKMLLDALDSRIQNSETQSRITQLKFRKLMLNFGIKREDLKENNGIVDKDITNKAWADRIIHELSEFSSLIEIPQYFDICEYYNFLKGVSEKIPIIENHNDFDNLFEKVTMLKDRYNGNNSSIKDLMKRAIRIFRCGKYSRSIEQFQKIKTKAFNPDELYDCVFAYYYIGLCFEQMGLLYASKYYFLTAFYLSNELDSDYNAKQLTYECGMDNIAKINFSLNHTKEAVYSTVNSLMLRSYYSSNIIDFSDRENSQNSNINTLFNLIIQVYINEKLFGSEDTFNLMVNLFNNFGVLDIIERSIASLTSDERKILTDNIEQREDRTLLDIKKDRSYSWQQLGVNWIVKWDNEVVPPPISDEFISYIQIILFSLRDIDISFIEDTILINLSISEDVEYGGIRDGYGHTVNLSENASYSSYRYHIGNIFGALYGIITNCAIVSEEQFHEEIKPIFRDNYLSNSYQYIWINIFGSERID